MPALVDIPGELMPVAAIVQRALARVETCFSNAASSDLPPVQQLCEHVERYRGKMLRPTLVVLCGIAADPRSADLLDDSLVNDEHIIVAAVCEMIHMATLVHDDVLDQADTRRRGQTVNSLYSDSSAVVLGDFLFSCAYRLCSTLSNQNTAITIGQTGMTLCSGELLQLHHQGDADLDEKTYFDIIDRKTASLIATACRLGAGHSGASNSVVESLDAFGRRLGTAFQIQDDLLDLTGNQDVVGKPLLRDVELGKLTLPLIHHLSRADVQTRQTTLALVRERTVESHADSPAAASTLLSALNATDSIQYASQRAQDLIDEAKCALAVLHDSPARRYLDNIADAVIDRKF